MKRGKRLIEVKKKVLSILLIASMLITYMPQTAYAELKTASKQPEQKPIVVMKAVSKKNSIRLSWTKTKGAAKYLVCGNRCGKGVKVQKNHKIIHNKKDI